MVKKRPFYLALFPVHLLMSRSVKLSKVALTQAEKAELSKLQKKLSQYNLAEMALPRETVIRSSMGCRTFYSIGLLAGFLASQARTHAWASDDVLSKFRCTYLDWRKSEYSSLDFTASNQSLRDVLDRKFGYYRITYSDLLYMYLRVQELRR